MSALTHPARHLAFGWEAAGVRFAEQLLAVNLHDEPAIGVGHDDQLANSVPVFSQYLLRHTGGVALVVSFRSVFDQHADFVGHLSLLFWRGCHRRSQIGSRVPRFPRSRWLSCSLVPQRHDGV